MNYIFIDLEMNDVVDRKDTCKKEIIQIGAVKYNKYLKEIDSFSILIKPRYNDILKDITSLTGITNEKVSDANYLEDELDKFLDFCGDDYRIISWSNNDYYQIKRETEFKNIKSDRLKYMLKHWFDFQYEFGKMLDIGKGHRASLGVALSITGNSFRGKQHDALSDARNTAFLYKISRNKKAFSESYKDVARMFFPKEEGFTIKDLIGEDVLNNLKLGD